MLAYDAYYMYQASSGSLQQDYRRKPGGAEPKNAQIADDILSLVVAMTQVECTGRFSHLAAKPEETLRSIETIPGLVDFQTYVQMTEDTAKLKNDLSVVQTQKKGRGKYVVLQQDAGPDVNAGFAAESIPNQEEEGWALV